jgi:TrmH family RNA methyltransferase
MKKPILITSPQNPRIKEIRSLEKASNRKALGLFCIEGDKETRLALAGGYKTETVVFCEELIQDFKEHPVVQRAQNIIQVNQAVFNSIAVREDSGGILSICRMQDHGIGRLKPGKNPLILVLESVEKPGNLGALLRTADAAGLDAVILCDHKTDIYNPNVIRSSTGCLFTIPLAIASTSEAIGFLKSNSINIWCTHLEASKPYYKIDFQESAAIVMGTESTGLSATWTDHATGNIIIPMHGKTDSMNVSTAAAVVVFEALRQRAIKK